MARLVVIGIDAMDPIVFETIRAEMPHLSSIAKSGGFKRCSSVFPPDSIPAWVTIFTGEYPEKHGWLDNIDYEDIRRGADVGKLCDLQGRTFWDRVGQTGKRVCIINPLLAYPIWPVNGVMANGPVFISGEKQIHPKELAARYELPELGGMTDFPSEKELDQFLDSTLQSTQDLAQFGLNLLSQEQWDLFFISFFTLDRIQHFLWRFWDTTDPLYPGPSNLESSIVKVYRTFDEIVARFAERLDNSTGLIVLSDHGHGQRPTMLLNLNEWLRQSGLLRTCRRKYEVISLRTGIEIIKNSSVKLVVRVLGEDWLYRIGRLIPRGTRKALKKSSYLIDKEASLAWASDVGGGASVGGIVINSQLDRTSREYKNVVSKTMASLERLPLGPNGPVIRWAEVREDRSVYPDIIFELDPHFSVGSSFFSPILDASPRHRVISGGHKKEGVLFTHNCGDLASGISGVGDISQAITSFVLSK